jgi:amino acid permease
VALEYSAFFAVVLEIFIPMLLVYKLRGNSNYKSAYKVGINKNFLLVFLLGIGLLLMALIIAGQFNLLPKL